MSHIQNSGFSVTVTETEAIEPLKQKHGIPPKLQSCHTALINDYVIEGHVPAADILRLLSEKPQALGLTVPGMPAGSRGMEQEGKNEAYTVYLFDKNNAQVFATHKAN